jgi:electron transport complex protein RnfC
MSRFTFRGGVHPPSRKSETSQIAITQAPPPARVILPLQHDTGLRYRPLVNAGDGVALGQPVAVTQQPESVVCHASVSGRVASIGPHPHFSGRNQPSIVIDNDGLDRRYGHPSPSGDVSSLSAEELLQRIREAGVVGMGQGREAAHLRISRAMDAKPQTVILNGIESEPFLASELRLMIERTEDVLSGLRLMMRILGVKTGKVAVPEDNRESVRSLRRALGRTKSIAIFPMDVKYPMDSEKQLAEALTGRNIPSGHRSVLDSGIYVENVSAACAMADAVARKPVIERVITVAGDGVGKPRNLKVRIGTPIRELIENCAGYTSDRIRLIHGGPMAGLSLSTDGIPATKETAGILAFMERPDERPHSEKACISCGRCWDCCPMRLYPRKIEYWLLEGDFQRAVASGLEVCTLCGACGYICPSKRQLTGRMAAAKIPAPPKEGPHDRREES